MGKTHAPATRAQALREEADALARAIEHLATLALDALRENP